MIWTFRGVLPHARLHQSSVRLFAGFKTHGFERVNPTMSIVGIETGSVFLVGHMQHTIY